MRHAKITVGWGSFVMPVDKALQMAEIIMDARRSEYKSVGGENLETLMPADKTEVTITLLHEVKLIQMQAAHERWQAEQDAEKP